MPAEDFYDLVVIGSHPSAGVAAVVAARQCRGIRLLHVALPDTPDDRLVAINPKLASLHPAIKQLGLLTGLHPLHGLTFLPDSVGARGEFISKAPALLVGSMSAICASLADSEKQLRINRVAAGSVRVVRVVDDGVAMAVDGRSIVARVVILAAELPPKQKRLLGISAQWEPGVLQRYSYLKFSRGKGGLNLPPGKTVPMSLDLAGSTGWGWLLYDGASAQVATMLPTSLAAEWPADRLMQRWIDQLALHGMIGSSGKRPAGEAVRSIDLPIGGALSGETVANRTLLIGPAGGFYSACGEDVYPNCWSAVAAAEVAVEALDHRHVQDALQSYRAKWGTTLGDYLRGPQQNLKLLLPLVYRNQVMAARVAEAILFSHSVVR